MTSRCEEDRRAGQQVTSRCMQDSLKTPGPTSEHSDCTTAESTTDIQLKNTARHEALPSNFLLEFRCSQCQR